MFRAHRLLAASYLRGWDCTKPQIPEGRNQWAILEMPHHFHMQITSILSWGPQEFHPVIASDQSPASRHLNQVQVQMKLLRWAGIAHFMTLQFIVLLRCCDFCTLKARCSTSSKNIMTRFIAMRALLQWCGTEPAVSARYTVVLLNISPGAQFLAIVVNCKTKEKSSLSPRHPTYDGVTGKGKQRPAFLLKREVQRHQRPEQFWNTAQQMLEVLWLGFEV